MWAPFKDWALILTAELGVLQYYVYFSSCLHFWLCLTMGDSTFLSLGLSFLTFLTQLEPFMKACLMTDWCSARTNP